MSSNEGYTLLKRLVNFMNIPIEDGVEIISPDENYVLTQDNLTKIMGIQTRFRYVFDIFKLFIDKLYSALF